MQNLTDRHNATLWLCQEIEAECEKDAAFRARLAPLAARARSKRFVDETSRAIREALEGV